MSLGFKLDHAAIDRHIFCSHFTMNLSQQTLDKDTLDLLDLGMKFVPTITLLELKTTMEDERRTLRKIALHDYWSGRPKQNDNQPDFCRHFISRSTWTSATHQISDFTIKNYESNL